MADSAGKTTYHIDLEPIGRRVDIAAGQTLLDAARAAGIEMVAVCGGEGWCYTCLVRPLTGSVSAITAAEQDGTEPR